MNSSVNIFWFRRDLRLSDNAGLYHALRSKGTVVPLFIFDKNILDELEDKEDRRVEFIYQAVQQLSIQLQEMGSDIIIRYGHPLEIFNELTETFGIMNVFANHDYEPYAIQRDSIIKKLLSEKGIGFATYKDQVILEKSEVVKDDGKPYTIFTPYSRKWKTIVTEFHLKSFPTVKYFDNFHKLTTAPFLSLESMGFIATGQPFPSKEYTISIIKQYKEQRNIPSIHGTSRLSVHLRFGTISIRELASEAGSLNETFLNELIWRDFYHMILWHFPTVVSNAFKPAYDAIQWRNNEREFAAWCKGETGYPIVDAGMRELNTTGFMHNRVRMIVASFLTKHLLIDWRWGEAYFAKKLLDFDLAANNGGWQWAAGSGCDAAPYFRIFNPALQTKKFDPELKYIRKWVPEFEEFTYPKPIVEHEIARKRCLEVYAAALKK